MKKNLLSFLFCCICFTSIFAQTVYKNYADGKVYVKFTKATLKSISKEDPSNLPLTKLGFIDKLISKYNITRAHIPFYQASDDPYLPYILKLEFTNITGVNELIRDLGAVQGVEYAEKVSIMKTDATTPNDFSISSASVHLTQINAQNAWDHFNGNSNITVAIVDNAVMWNHADLAANIYTNTVEFTGITGIDDDGNGYIDDINGWDAADNTNDASHPNNSLIHGTHCAGIAGARTDNSSGIASIGWNIKIIPVQCEPDASNSTTNITNGYEGIIYAVKAKARIISCSWGNQVGSSQTEQYVIDYAWNRGSIIIASAGNAGNTLPNYPGAYNHVYCVAAVNGSDVMWSGSNHGSWIDISAPGVNIYSTVPYSGTPAYMQLTGTSMATPMVAGLAGLMLSKSPGMTRSNVLNCISTTATNIYTLSGNSSYINQLGAGRIDAYAAMVCASSYSVIPPVANFYAFLPNTCPNTPIPFIDSSLYNPTTWSWVFQGGTPATSTSSNPSVQWSTPGTYSVSLTVTNANGTHTATKLSYITVTGPVSLPFQEGFQAAQFLPSGWLANNIWNDNMYWERVTGVGGFGTSTACAMFNNYDINVPGEHDEMRSPKFDFSNVASARLRFDVAYCEYSISNSDTLVVKASVDCGTTWTTIYTKGGSALATSPSQGVQFVPLSTEWRRDTIDISALTAGHTNVMFSFINHGHYGQPIYLDNINLVFPTPTLSPGNSNSICISPTYTFNNSSLAAANYTWNFQGGSPASSTASNPAVSYASPGTYTFSMLGVNGTSTASITKTITVLNNPVISGTAANYCSGNSYTLNATGAASYTWSSSAGQVATGSSLVVIPTASSFYTLTGSNGACAAQGVYTLNVNPSPNLSVSDVSICPGNSATLTASGATSYSWNTNATTSSITASPNTSTQYTVTGTAAGCSTTKTVSIVVSALPLSTVNINNPACFNSCSGMITTLTSGGNGPYTYTLNNGLCTSASCANLCAGSYTLQTSNALGCSTSTVFSITTPAALQASMNPGVTVCSACPNGVLSVQPSGGVPPYTYSWAGTASVSSTGNTANNLVEGCYTVTVMDANTCSTEATACVLVGSGIQSLHYASALSIYPNPVYSAVTIELKGSTFNYRIYTALGQLATGKTENKDSCTIELGEFAKGVYLVEIEIGRDIVRKKLVLE